MNNFPIKKDGQTYWVSRSCAVAAIVFVGLKDDELYVLATKRGKAAADFQGYWCMPCGYIDYNESGEQAASRETFEETGVKINHNAFRLVGVQTSPDANRQNITLRYLTIGNDVQGIVQNWTTKNNDVVDEVEEIRLISIDEIHNYKWCFGHKELIKKYVDKVVDCQYCKVNDIKFPMF